MGILRPSRLRIRVLMAERIWFLKSISRALAVAVIALVTLPGRPAQASLALLLEQPYGGLGRVNPTGHAALYLDHVCAASPLQLRPCGPGELGVVISRYDGIGNHDWLAIPLVPYLYAVDSAAEIPETMDRVQEAALRDAYRRRELEDLAPDLPDGRAPDGNWYELIGSAYDRTIYGFSVHTTPEQDARVIALFNDRRNVERYNGAFRNCADFARVTINRLYPHAIRRNFVADFGFTTPKQVARGLTRYAKRHPQMGLHVFVVPQVKGSLPRSHPVQGITEGLIKRYGVPLIVLSPVATAVVFVAYMGHGRFDIPENAPVLDLRQQTALAERAAREARQQPLDSGAIAEEGGGEWTRREGGLTAPLLAGPAGSALEMDSSVPEFLTVPPPTPEILRAPGSE